MCSRTSYNYESFPQMAYSNMGYAFTTPPQIQRTSTQYINVLDAEALSQKVRVLQDNLVFVSGLPPELADLEVYNILHSDSWL